ncbi:VOC family protein [Pseudonocardiaceae bacterium YIM PH 21723]|nr:VOC family protein [Pseudonocardiaceae bacterium YIM PH 21723]
MPQFSNHVHGAPCWVDLGVPDIHQGLAFYQGLFGWDAPEIGPAEMGHYTMLTVDGRNVAALSQNSPEETTPPRWTTYLATDDLDDTLERVRKAGGEVVVDAMDVMTAGRMAIVNDPLGCVFGLWQAGEHIGYQLKGDPVSVVWTEHLSRDAERAREFYADILGVTSHRIPDEGIDYSIYMPTGLTDGVGGIFDIKGHLPDSVPHHWATYFAVQDVDATVAKASELGATIIAPPFDTPYGRMAGIMDPAGAVFNVMVPAMPE